MPGPGRHFYSPLEYETDAGQGPDHPARQARRRRLQGRQAAALRRLPGRRREGYHGILRTVLTPGRYRINSYAFDVKVVDVDACVEPVHARPAHGGRPDADPAGLRRRRDQQDRRPAGRTRRRASRPRSSSPASTSSTPRRSGSTSSASATTRPPCRSRPSGAPGATSRGDRLGKTSGEGPGLRARQGDRVPVQRRLPDPPRLHGDLGHPARAGARRRPPVRHAQGRRAEGDPAPDRLDLPAPRLEARRRRPAGRRRPARRSRTRRRRSSSESSRRRTCRSCSA